MLNIKKIVDYRIKQYIKYLISTKKQDTKELRDLKKIIVCLGADYGNVGDIAITFAQIKFLKELFPQYKVVEFPISQTFVGLKDLKSIVSANDIITIVGGGNTSERYKDIEFCRQFIIKKFPQNVIVTFPQSVEIENSSPAFLRQMRKTYVKHPNLCYMVRDKYSQREIEKYIPELRLFLFPDIVLSLGIYHTAFKRKYATISMRRDKEAKLSVFQRDEICEKVSCFNDMPVVYRDTQITEEMVYNKENRKKELDKVMRLYLQSKVVITDRLHGMILAYITNTPCLVLSCDSTKIKGCYQWIKDSERVFFIENYSLSELEKGLNELLKKQMEDNQPIDFKEMKDLLEKCVSGCV